MNWCRRVHKLRLLKKEVGLIEEMLVNTTLDKEKEEQLRQAYIDGVLLYNAEKFWFMPKISFLLCLSPTLGGEKGGCSHCSPKPVDN